MKKIMHIVFSLGTGGLENMLVDIANVQARSHTVLILIINRVIDYEVEKRLSDKVRLVKINREPGQFSFASIFKTYSACYQFRPDQIHCHHINALRLFIFPLPFLTRNVVFTVHDTFINCGKEINNAQRVCAISKSVKKDLLERQHIASEVIYNGIPVLEIPRRSDYGISKHWKIVQVSRLDHEKKGQDLLLKAIAGIKQCDSNLHIHVDFIGGGDSQTFLEAMADELGIAEQISFRGSLPKSELYQQLQHYDMLVQPSRYEGFGLTVAEGMVAGVPVIVSDREGPMEVIAEGTFGSYFESGNSDDLAKQILRIIERYQSDSIGQQVDQAYEYACREFNIERTAQQYAAL